MAKLLLVEDDLNLQEIYGARLEAEGYEVAVASDGESALATAVKEKPDVVVLDIMMPKISGFDVLDILRQTPEVKETKVILLTALSQESDKQRGKELGANKYLVKSQITLEDVVNAVKEVLGESPTPEQSPSQSEQPGNNQPVSMQPNQAGQQQPAPGKQTPANNQQSAPPSNQQPAPKKAPRSKNNRGKQNQGSGQQQTSSNNQSAQSRRQQPAPPQDNDDTPPPSPPSPGSTVSPQQ